MCVCVSVSVCIFCISFHIYAYNCLSVKLKNLIVRKAFGASIRWARQSKLSKVPDVAGSIFLVGVLTRCA